MAHPDAPFQGTCTAIGIAVNAQTSSISWGGTPDTMVWFYPNADSVTYRVGDRDVNTVPDICRYPSRFSLGGKVSSGSFQIPVTYANSEKIFQLISGGAITTTGASAPYSHAMALSKIPRYGKISHYFTNAGVASYGDSFTNMKITNLQMTYNAGDEPVWQIDWIAGTHTADSSPSAPTVSAFSVVDWQDMVLTLAGAVYRVNGLTFGIADAVTPHYGSAGSSGNHGEPLVLTPNAPLATTLNLDLLFDSTVKTGILANQGTLLGTSSNNSIVFNNGGTGAAEEELEIVLGSMVQNGTEEVHGTVGDLTISIPFLIMDATTPFTFTTKNSLSTIPA